MSISIRFLTLREGLQKLTYLKSSSRSEEFGDTNINFRNIDEVLPPLNDSCLLRMSPQYPKIVASSPHRYPPKTFAARPKFCDNPPKPFQFDSESHALMAAKIFPSPCESTGPQLSQLWK